MPGDVVIRAEGLGKKYAIGHQAERQPYYALRDVIARGARDALRKAADLARGRALIGGDEIEEFWALKDVSFEVRRGEVLGIIGRNGAGKSTLLKILSRITEPSAGRVEIDGRVASLLEVGTGFHPELTGRENIYLNGAILGMTRAEIRKKFDEIVAFAEVEKFLDTPVKRYSSGMYVRLAFAVAAHLEPEILVVDEVLAVGDAEFQKKCLGKMDEVSRREGRTVLFVSHNMGIINSLTSSVILLSNGFKKAQGNPRDIVYYYLTCPDRTLQIKSSAPKNNPDIQIEKILVNRTNERIIILDKWPCELFLKLYGYSRTRGYLTLEAKLVSAVGSVAALFFPGHFADRLDIVNPGTFQLHAHIHLPPMVTGRYFLNLSLTDPGRITYWEQDTSIIIDAHGPVITALGEDVTNAKSHASFFLSGRVALQPADEAVLDP